MNVRDAVEADLPAIVDIYNSTIPTRQVSADTEPVSVESRLPWFRAHSPATRPFWVAETNGEILGWLAFGWFYDGRPAYRATAEISIYIAVAHRQRGLGRELLHRAIAHAPTLGIKTLTAGAFAHNVASVGLFSSAGFTIWGRYPRVAELDGVERDLIVMGLRLDEKERQLALTPIEE